MSARATTPNSLLPLSTTTAPEEETFIRDLNVRLAAVQAENVVRPIRQISPVYFPGAPIGTPHPSYPSHPSRTTPVGWSEKSTLDIFSHAHIHTYGDIELGLQASNSIAPPTSAKRQRKAPRWVAYVAASLFMGGVVVGSVVGLVYYMTKHRDVSS
ncbi:hypothetical protein L202_01841 [Cryptococcus amylolentus CBS 6039]|uniref:Uncharacterized protein n=1 Tax=Cryptococcus amylolentus CBS 6039 TaxID=1295533 RepID=A0A1E3I570_9TREE|nr:hypothetical protein L202_01841 [Cryptococcus amylolentus CBS 6039]ODN83749.1 hypothetical protein L202_01841 [Cryptococcus amylolentus CBS 6039]